MENVCGEINKIIYRNKQKWNRILNKFSINHGKNICMTENDNPIQSRKDGMDISCTSEMLLA